MSTMSATEASRNFSALLDAVERGDTVTITRGNRPIAEIRPSRRRVGKDLREALAALPPLDEEFEADVASALSLITERDLDPWREG